MTRQGIVAVFGPLVLCGCATNALRVETTRSFVDTSTATVASAKAYLGDVAQRRRAANAALIAAEPSCQPYRDAVTNRYVVYVRKAAVARGRPDSFCVPSRERPSDANSFPLELDPISRQLLKPRLAVLAATADYASALAKVLDGKSPDLDEELGGIAGKLDDVGVIAGVAGVRVPSAASALGSKEGTALVAALQMVADLAHERRQVADIRRIALQSGDAVDAGLESILADMRDFAEADHDSVARAERANVLVYRRQTDLRDFEQRRAVALALANVEEDFAASAASARQAEAAVLVLIEAHRDLRAVLQPDPTLTAAQKKRVAEITRQRIWRALDLISGAVSALAGA
ncbi:hypothetical protein ASE86_03790 [Sphingomonas sp. Leaf33]|nr:hypothetical protein ASE86_03790 [Sphingomonas sp. Leaf33]